MEKGKSLESHKRFLLISYYFPPAGGGQAAGSIRIGKFAEYVSEFGWQPTILSTNINMYPTIDETLISIDESSVVRINDPIPQFKGKHRIDCSIPSPGLQLLWVIKSIIRGNKLIRNQKIKAIMATTPPPSNIFIALALHLFNNVPLIIDYRDQWSNTPYRVGPRIYKYFDVVWEKITLSHTSVAILSNKQRKDEYDKLWSNYCKNSIVIPNGFDQKVTNCFTKGYKLTPNVLTIRHLGAIYGAREIVISNFLDTINQYCNHEPDFKVVLELIGSMNKTKVRQYRSDRFICNITDNVDYLKSIELQKTADVLLLIIGQHKQSNSELSSKVFEYIIAKRPILVIGKSYGLECLLKEFNYVFYIIDEKNIEEIEKFVSWFKGIDNNKIAKDVDTIIESDFSKYSRKNIAGLLAEALDNITAY